MEPGHGATVSRALLTGTGYIGAVAFSPDGKTLASGGPGCWDLWNVGYLVDVLTRLCAQVGRFLDPSRMGAARTGWSALPERLRTAFLTPPCELDALVRQPHLAS